MKRLTLLSMLALFQKPSNPPDCTAELIALGHQEAVAIQTFQKAAMPTVSGMTPAHEMFQAADDFLRIERACKPR